MGRVFISYAREDVATAERLYNDLKRLGADPWMDTEDLVAGESWKSTIESAIKESSHFLVLISEHSVTKRGYVQKEVVQALQVLDEVPPNQIYVVPVRLDESKPTHARLNELHWVDLFLRYDEGLERIASSLGIPKQETGGTFAETSPPRTGRSDEMEGQEDVMQMIRSRAQRDFPDDFSTQRYQINQELEAWRKLQAFEAPDIPELVLDTVMKRAEGDFPDDFSTRLYQIRQELDAWADLHKS